eukprot:TRINITY_DN10999_c0_g5_i1.p2 TRINITY_DN10999_c0_g5~~TRINITY_DN10999_c0_g5_i1.p2  ORF type:complete len:140 (+),score=36.15 TRINITY_DN10999_c0_g5_i1:768-1187(+)
MYIFPHAWTTMKLQPVGKKFLSGLQTYGFAQPAITAQQRVDLNNNTAFQILMELPNRGVQYEVEQTPWLPLFSQLAGSWVFVPVVFGLIYISKESKPKLQALSLDDVRRFMCWGPQKVDGSINGREQEAGLQAAGSPFV